MKTKRTDLIPTDITVCVGNIVQQPDCDAIINSANTNLRAGSGVCGAIHAAAGPELEIVSQGLAPLGLGKAVATPGFRLPNSVVIHVRGPKYHFDPDPPLNLASAIRNGLQLAEQHGIQRIAVPAISMGVYAYPPEEAVPILVRTAHEVGTNLRHLREIRFVVIGSELKALFDEHVARWRTHAGGGENIEGEQGPVTGRVVTPSLMEAVRRRYRLRWSGIHGVQHWARVRKYGLELARHTGARTDVVELFAFLHDSCREEDGLDLDHGRRAADFAAELFGHQVLIDKEGFDLLCEAMAYHNEGLTEADVTVQTCWDADRLDLTRLDIDPDPDRLCTAAARRMAKDMARQKGRG